MRHNFELYHYLPRQPGVNLTRNKTGFILTVSQQAKDGTHFPADLSIDIRAKNAKPRTRIDIPSNLTYRKLQSCVVRMLR